MKFVKLDYQRILGHASTCAQAIRILKKLEEGLYSHTAEKPLDKEAKALRQRLGDIKQLFTDLHVADGLTALRDLHDDQEVPDDITQALEEVTNELSIPKEDVTTCVMLQLDKNYDVIFIEDGREGQRSANLDDPVCTIVFRNGLWRMILGRAENIANTLEAACPR